MDVNISLDWVPTPDNINALPKPLRDFIHHLSTEADPAGTTADNYRLRQENAGLRTECEKFAAVLKDYGRSQIYGAAAREALGK